MPEVCHDDKRVLSLSPEVTVTKADLQFRIAQLIDGLDSEPVAIRGQITTEIHYLSSLLEIKSKPENS